MTRLRNALAPDLILSRVACKAMRVEG
jgi:hypothetical protein